MSTCLVIIDNYVSNTQISISYTADDFLTVDQRWNGSDVLLRELNDNGHFADHNTWGKLTMDEWYILLARTIEMFTEMPEKDQLDPTNSTVKSFNFLILGTLKRISLDTKQTVNFLRLQIMQNGEFSINVTSAINLISGKQGDIPSPNLQVVVDNGY